MDAFDWALQFGNSEATSVLARGQDAADATATREVADYESAANQQTAERTNSLAQRLATARRTPGGGIRMGVKRKGMSANSAGAGLISANASGRLTRRKNELRAQNRKEAADTFNAKQAAAAPVVQPWSFTCYY